MGNEPANQKIRENNIEKLRKLEEYRSQGYLFHGTKNLLDVIEPQQARNDDGSGRGNKFAVYASSSLEVPIFMALFDSHVPNKGRWSSYSISNESAVIRGRNLNFTNGYIHVLNPTTFSQENERSTDMISGVPVTPIDAIEVDPTILELIPNLKIDIDNS